jgi:2'-deoxynucleoside 5'-phosphate N-hydrolase
MKPIAYIAGALTDLPTDLHAPLRKFYEDIGDLCDELGFTGLVPHRWGDPLTIKDATPEFIDKHDREQLATASVLIAYVGRPSLGTGIEIEIAHRNKKPIILYEKDRLEQRLISRFVRGNPSVVAQIAFTNYEDAKAQLRVLLPRFLKN